MQKPLRKDLQTVVMVQSQQRLNGQTKTETRYYTGSLASQASKIAEAVRTHWSIENCLHWVLMSPSMKMPVAFAKAMHLKIWRCCVRLP